MGIKRNRRSFTLIEMIVVISVIAITLPSIFAIVFGIVQQQTKIYRISKVKEEGDYILNLISNTIKNRAFSIHSSSTADGSDQVCKDSPSSIAPANSLYFRDLSNDMFGYSFSSNTISSASSKFASSISLNSDKISIDNFIIYCDKNTTTFSAPIISIEFDISYKLASTRPEDSANLHYQTKVKLRN